MSHWNQIVFYPDTFLHLQQELPHHPELVELLKNHEDSEWQVKLAEIATYCEIALDGVYDPHDLGKIAGILHKRLLERRPGQIPIVVINPFV
jgi:hypothetical protein